MQCSPAAHSGNLHRSKGERDFVPGFPYPPGYSEPFPRLKKGIPVRQKDQELRDMILYFFSTCRDTGSAEAIPFWVPVLDWDDDGLTDETESTLGTDPYHPDTDGDEVNDGDEIAAGTDPLDPEDFILPDPEPDP